MTKNQKIFRGVIWSGIERFSVQIIQFIVTLILARLLTPTDFGIVAIVLVFLNILLVFNEVGFGEALLHLLDRDELDLSTTFVFNIVWGIVLYLILFFLAPFFARFFDLPELTFLTRIAGLNLIIGSFVVVQRTILMIRIDFKTQAKASLIAVIISGIISIVLAYRGVGVMALIIQHILNTFIATLLMYIFSDWKISLRFSFERFKRLFSYAYKLILARFIHTVFTQIYAIVIGRVYSPALLGYYNRANSFIIISSNNITSIVQRVSTPILCEKQSSSEEMGNTLLMFIQKTAFIVFPLLMGLFILAEPLIKVLLTEKWLPAAWMLQVLVPVGILYLFNTFNLNIFNATGRTDWALRTEIIKKTVNILIIVAAISISFEALIYSQIVIAIFEFFVNIYYTKKQIGLTLIKQLNAVKGIIIVSSLMVVVIYLVTYYINSDFGALMVGFTTGVIFYISVCFVFNISDFKNVALSFLSLSNNKN